MQERPYFNFSIVQLEELYDQKADDSAVLRSLQGELEHRTKPRAMALLSKIQKRLLGEDDPQLDLIIREDANQEQDTNSETSSKAVTAIEVADTPNNIITESQTHSLHELPPKVELSELPDAADIEDDDSVHGILSAWTALEALTPQTFRRPHDLVAGDRRRIVKLEGNQTPWPKGKAVPNFQLYYQVPLGTISLGPATEDLVSAFGEQEEFNFRRTERSVIAAVLVDRSGVPLEENSVAISSFAWALPQALAGKLGSLGAWASIEQRLVEGLTKVLIQRDADGHIMPLNAVHFDIAYRWLVRQFNLAEHLVEPPSFAMRVLHWYRSSQPPEVSLLNSFFLRDLDKADKLEKQGSIPEGLQRYLGAQKPANIKDLLSDQSAIENAVSPIKTSAARWPSPGGFPLVLLQQAAVNLTREVLAGKEGIIAVNGPPGTGKTTLLRDVVAACIFDRAKAMATFNDPQDAFKPSGERLAVGGNAFLHLYKLDPSIKGHEIVVASSNNKAVENVSRELPLREAIGRSSDEFSYLQTLSDCVHERAAALSETDDQESRTRAAGEETWGMIAAVLGNAKNRNAFVQSFWWDDDRGIRLYLQAAKGHSVVREIRDEDGKIVKRNVPKIVENEKPPTPEQARRNWTKARKRFLELTKEVEAALNELEKVRQVSLELEAVNRQIGETSKEVDAASQKADMIASLQAARQSELDVALNEHKTALRNLRIYDSNRPGLLSRLFRTKAYRSWSSGRLPPTDEESRTRKLVSETEASVQQAELASVAQARIVDQLNEKLASLQYKAGDIEAHLEPWRVKLGDRFVDQLLFERGHEASNLESPWIPDELHRKREEVFVAAMQLHRAFIDGAAQKLQHNLGALMNFMQTGKAPDEKRRALLPDLWSTLSAVVPVISTTFASVDRMLGELPSGSLGWLLVDEAGQAVPQAAVGAIARTKRTIVVGDPLQIPPVVTLPDLLINSICRQFRVDSYDWTAPNASVQTLADRASTYQASFRGEYEPRRVGVPLLVHRRCQEPMFSVSNAIAYDGQMVHAAGQPSRGIIGSVLGVSRWINIDGEAETKWSPAEGEIAVKLLQDLATKGVRDPSLFVVSPFRDVAIGLRQRLRTETDMFARFDVDAKEWLDDRIGTIHTVQGREAQAVIFVLGAPAAKQAGARSWATNTPNIFNVAVSRAKQNLYVIGSHGAWSGSGYARKLANALPVAEK